MKDKNLLPTSGLTPVNGHFLFVTLMLLFSFNIELIQCINNIKDKHGEKKVERIHLTKQKLPNVHTTGEGIKNERTAMRREEWDKTVFKN